MGALWALPQGTCPLDTRCCPPSRALSHAELRAGLRSPSGCCGLSRTCMFYGGQSQGSGGTGSGGTGTDKHRAGGTGTRGPSGWELSSWHVKE